MSTKKALVWVIFWVSVAMAFNVVVYYWLGKHKAIEFLTGYIVEESLSVDNLFVFLLLFRHLCTIIWQSLSARICVALKNSVPHFYGADSAGQCVCDNCGPRHEYCKSGVAVR